MSRQNKTPRLAIVPDDISTPPGTAEAAEIRRLYDISNAGIRAFVMMGFRLIDVKARLPHGSYVKWIEDHLGDRNRSHLHRSRQIAEAIALRLEWDSSNVAHAIHLETLPAEVCDLIDGKGYRTLLMELREPLSDDAAKAEEDCRIACEKRWAKDAEERDEWEPRVLSGEITYHRALTGMVGKTATQGQPKKTGCSFQGMLHGIGKFGKYLPDFEDLPAPAKATVLEKVELLADELPPACRQAMMRVWTKGGKL